MAQQSVQKALKSVFCSPEKPIPLVHDIGFLVGQLSTFNETPPKGILLADLTPYASLRRYQEGSVELTDDDLAGAINMAEEVLSWAKTKIEIQD